ARADAVFLVARQIDELAHPRQRMRQPRDRRSRQPAAVGDLEIAEPRLVPLETSQDVKRARYHLNDVILACTIASEQSLPTQPLRASSHALPHLFRSAEQNSTCRTGYLRQSAATTRSLLVCQISES